MNRISLRLRIAILTGLVIMISSLLTSFYSMRNANTSLEYTADTITQNISIMETKSNGTIADEGLASPLYDEYAIEESSSFEESFKPFIDGVLIELKSRFSHNQLVFSGVLSLLGMLLSYFYSGLILRPIKTLADEISSIQTNDLDYQIEIKNKKDVLGVLAMRFNELLKRLNRYIKRQKEYSNNVAHELKTPLTVMKTSLQVLDEDSSLEEYKETFKIQEKNIERLNNIVNDLLLFKEEEIKEEDIDFNLIVKEVLDEYQSLIQEKKLNVYIEEENVITSGNHALVRRLISNLFSNAIRYNKENGAIYLEIKKNYFSIRDTGIGIEEKYLSEIFEPFYCVDKSRSRDLGGSGLGLSLVKSIVDALEYEIEVSSKVQLGTEFVIYFNKDR